MLLSDQDTGSIAVTHHGPRLFIDQLQQWADVAGGLKFGFGDQARQTVNHQGLI